MIRDLRDTKTDRRKFLRDLATASGLAAVAGSVGAVVAAPAAEPVGSGRDPGCERRRSSPMEAGYGCEFD